jgi:hypothetical protein
MEETGVLGEFIGISTIRDYQNYSERKAQTDTTTDQ